MIKFFLYFDFRCLNFSQKLSKMDNNSEAISILKDRLNILLLEKDELIKKIENIRRSLALLEGSGNDKSAHSSDDSISWDDKIISALKTIKKGSTADIVEEVNLRFPGKDKAVIKKRVTVRASAMRIAGIIRGEKREDRSMIYYL